MGVNDLGSIKFLFQKLIVILHVFVVMASGQVSTPCTASMITNFTPCFNYITGSTSNGSSPTGDCCNAVRSFTGTNMDCLCLVLSANVPLPINSTLALTLPRACNMGFPSQCKASGSPLQSPGPAQLGPTLPPAAGSPFSPQASKAVAGLNPALSPVVETTTLAPSPVELEAITPKASPRIRPVLAPATSDSFFISSSSLLLLMFIGAIVMFMSS